MIGRGPLRRSHVLAVSVLTAGLVWAGFLTTPSPAYAGNAFSVSSAHVVIFTAQGSTTEQPTNAATVGAFLSEHGIALSANDYLSPAADTPISDRMSIEYRPAIAATIINGRHRETVVTSAPNVASLLQSQNLRLGKYDSVTPALNAAIPPNGIVRIDHFLRWLRVEHRTIAINTIKRVNLAVTPGKSKVAAKGEVGMIDVLVQFTQHANGDVKARVIGSRVVRKARPRIVEVGAVAAMQMIATAYTPYCGGCSGVTATGRPAGHGVVAVDPRVIPLGTRLYIPGYGYAVAGDTGGAIVGYRIDLGYTSNRDALEFGRRAVTVYRLK
ncbi:MAG TPA: 3D domain-containing protein [Candidatus Acidoferrales bacterium]|nr:3D domain-containing protein [Candidatus Acidoferrales bacterium]